MLEACAIGAFSSLDLVLFFVFFEASLDSDLFSYRDLGRHAGRLAAANKFFVYTVVGSLLMLASIIGLYVYTGTFDFVAIRTVCLPTKPVGPQRCALAACGLCGRLCRENGRVPAPHVASRHLRRSPDGGHGAAVRGACQTGNLRPVTGSAWGFFPARRKPSPRLWWALAVISIIYGALVAAAQKDAKRTLWPTRPFPTWALWCWACFSFTPQGCVRCDFADGQSRYFVGGRVFTAGHDPRPAGKPRLFAIWAVCGSRCRFSGGCSSSWFCQVNRPAP